MPLFTQRIFLLQLALCWRKSRSHEIVSENHGNINELRQLTGISWDIFQDPSATQYKDYDGNPVIRVHYAASEKTYAVKLYENDCETEIGDLIPFKATSSSSSMMENFMDVVLDLTLIPSELVGTSIWSNADSYSVISMCLSFGLYTAPPDLAGSILVTRLDKIFNIKVNTVADLKGGKIYGAMMGAKDGYQVLSETVLDDDELSFNNDMVVEYNGNVNSYQCDPTRNYEKVTSPQPLDPFDTLTICAGEIDSDSLSVHDFMSVTLAQSITNGGTRRFNAIVNGAIPDNHKDLVQADCLPTGICYVKIVVLDKFFSEREIQVNGEVILHIGSGKRVDNFDGITVELNDVKCDDSNIWEKIVVKASDWLNLNPSILP